jgi:hypothetical protein
METKELAKQVQMARPEEGTEECHEKLAFTTLRLLHLFGLNAQQVKQGNGQLTMGTASKIGQQIGPVCDTTKMLKQLLDWRRTIGTENVDQVGGVVPKECGQF